MPTDRDRQRLAGVHPTLVMAILRILTELPMFVTKGVRTQAEQQDLYAQGRTRPGPIVTFRDGILYKSDHQPHADGLGYAVDCAFLGNDPFAAIHDWTAYGAKVEAFGLIWGGRWNHPHDSVHAQLPDVA